MKNTESSIVGQLLPYIPIILLMYFIITRTLTWYRLRHFPGPFLCKFSYIYMVFVGASGRMNLIWYDMAKKYGPLVRIGPIDLMTSDPDIIRRTGAVRASYTRSTFYESMRLDPYVDNVFSDPDTARHDIQRARMAPAYSSKENPSFEAGIDACITQFIKLIRDKYLSTDRDSKPMDLGRKAQYFTMDVISKIAYGGEFGHLKADADSFEYIRTIDEVMVYMTFFSSIPGINSILNRGWFKEMFGPGPKDKTGMGKMMGVAQQVVSERFDGEVADAKDPQRDMLSIFIHNGVPKRRLESEVILQFAAGSDTTATAIRSTMLYLITHSRVLNKLRTELDNAETKAAISNPILYSEARNLPYLCAVVHEGLRIHPPLTTLLMKEVPPAGDTIKGHYIPGGTRIGYNTWALQRNEVFGEDVEVFRPERWLDVDEDRYMRMEQCMELIFGYGRWQCLGKAVAFMELHKLIAQLLRNFDFELVNPGQPWKSTNYLFFQQRDMWVRVSERERK